MVQNRSLGSFVGRSTRIAYLDVSPGQIAPTRESKNTAENEQDYKDKYKKISNQYLKII